MKHYTDEALLKILQGKTAGGMTLRQLSNKLGFSYQYLFEVLTNKKPMTVKLAKALGFKRVYVKQEEDTNA